MANVTEYSEIQQQAMRKIVKNDNNFHTSYYIADVPFAEMLQTNADGITFTIASATVSLVVPGGTAKIDLRHSDEQKCWFFTAEIGGEEIKGIVHFNTAYNAKGLNTIVFLNETALDDDESITRLLPYSNIFIMGK